jgi:hypothetical protein
MIPRKKVACMTLLAKAKEKTNSKKNIFFAVDHTKRYFQLLHRKIKMRTTKKFLVNPANKTSNILFSLSTIR